MAVIACGGGRSPCSVPSRAASHGRREVVAGGHRRVVRIHVLHSIYFSVDVSDVDISVYVDVDTDNHRTSTARTSGSVSRADRRRRPRARLPCGRPVLSAARTLITRTSRGTGRTDVDCSDFDQGRSSQRHLARQQAWDGQRHLTQQQAWDGDHAMRWGTRPGDAAGDAVGDAAIGRGGGAVASTHNPSAAMLLLRGL